MRLDLPLGCTLADMVLVAALCILADKLAGERGAEILAFSEYRGTKSLPDGGSSSLFVEHADALR